MTASPTVVPSASKQTAKSGSIHSRKGFPGTSKILFRTESIILPLQADLAKQPNFGLTQLGGLLIVDG
jgi:hypothetical protein